jgi:hypothetical protein
LRKGELAIYQVKVSLNGAQPSIWRRLLIERETTLQDLHRIIQVAMGWQASHLHLFQAKDGTLIGDPAEDFDGMMNFRDEAVIPVSAVLLEEGQTLHYEYDFGDSWEHLIALEKIHAAETNNGALPRCIKAVRQCPPEDVGGLPGFYEFLEAMEDMAHPEHIAVREWWGEWFQPDFVDLEQINADLAERHAWFPEDPDGGAPAASDFFGLSPAQVHELLQSPLNCPSVFHPLLSAKVVNEALDTAPIVRMARVLVDAMRGKGIRLTGKGNLPLKKTAETKLEKKGWLAAYQDLLNTALTRLSWASIDHYDGLANIQYTGAFCFWLLSQKGGQWRPVSEYLDDMLKAFPRLPLTAYPVSYMTEEDQAKSALRSRMVTLYQLLGLIELDPENARFREEGNQKMRRTALFEGMFVRA